MPHLSTFGTDGGCHRLESKAVRPLCQSRLARRPAARLAREPASGNRCLARGVRCDWHGSSVPERHLAEEAPLSGKRVAGGGRNDRFGDHPGNRSGNGSHRGSDCDLQTDLAVELQVESECESRRKLRALLRMQEEKDWCGEFRSELRRGCRRDMGRDSRLESRRHAQGDSERDFNGWLDVQLPGVAGTWHRLRLYSPARTAIICHRPYRIQNREEKP